MCPSRIGTDYTIQKIADIISGKLTCKAPGQVLIDELLTDSRKVTHPDTALFFAIFGERHNGHSFISELFRNGVRNFVISEFREEWENFNANFIRVDDALEALQEVGGYHRSRFTIPVVGITGSNGKTIVKEWLYQLLQSDRNIVRSPKSYNSQVGVPLSLWLIRDNHQLALIEAGISQPGEMLKLEKIIRPTIGILTNIGSAHDENFHSVSEKLSEKLRLFRQVSSLIYCRDQQIIQDAVDALKKENPSVVLFAWSRKSKADLQVGRITRSSDETEIQAVYHNRFIRIRIPFTDDASVENAIHCWAFMLSVDVEQDYIEKHMTFLSPVAMRLELKNGINHCSVINDTYNSDIGSLTIALDFLNQQKQHEKRTVILSDILQSGRDEENLYREVSNLLIAKNISRIIGIGEALTRQKDVFPHSSKFYPDTDHFLREFTPGNFSNETILLKGARPFGFEKISKVLQQKAHETVLEINLNALVHNLNYYRSRLRPDTRIMAMVKAASYGSGSQEIASVLQFHRVDYLAVAYSDEGVELRRAGITLPIMVMNPELQGLDAMLREKLEPEIYNFRLLGQLHDMLNRYDGEPFPVHIEIDTGMHRLGFDESEMNELIVRLGNNKKIRVQSVFSHLSASDEAEHDGFTRLQIERFTQMSGQICNAFDYPVLRHLLNSAGILRFSEAQFDMVRLGIGMYGIAATSHEQQQLQQVATLRSAISQIKNVPANETVGYSRRGVLKRDSVIATVAVGYADGVNRKMSNGTGNLMVNGILAPVVGNVCMDMTMIDITDIPAKEGDEVIVFGPDYPVTEIARSLGTIPYEILSNVNQRVKRIYFYE